MKVKINNDDFLLYHNWDDIIIWTEEIDYFILTGKEQEIPRNLLWLLDFTGIIVDKKRKIMAFYIEGLADHNDSFKFNFFKHYYKYLSEENKVNALYHLDVISEYLK